MTAFQLGVLKTININLPARRRTEIRIGSKKQCLFDPQGVIELGYYEQEVIINLQLPAGADA